MLAMLTALVQLAVVAAAAPLHSVLHMMIDDLRPELGAYGESGDDAKADTCSCRAAITAAC